MSTSSSAALTRRGVDIVPLGFFLESIPLLGQEILHSIHGYVDHTLRTG